jgi:hypothetical protein
MISSNTVHHANEQTEQHVFNWSSCLSRQLRIPNFATRNVHVDINNGNEVDSLSSNHSTVDDKTGARVSIRFEQRELLTDPVKHLL